VQPGGEGKVEIDYVMGHEMEGTHRFEMVVTSNDPVEPESRLYMQISYVTEVSGE
jgi:hypothetical protein